MLSALAFAPVSGLSLNNARSTHACGPRILTAAVFALSLITVANAQSRYEQDSDDQEASWQEAAIQLPPAPQPENLLPFYVSETATQTFAIDAKSLTIGSDGVIRYTLVARSASGAKNISYEGIRCQSFEKKRYAFGREDGTWSLSRRGQWERIVRNAANRQHATLALDYFCQNLTIADNVEKILGRIRMQQRLTQTGS
jgi:hypothetical protein